MNRPPTKKQAEIMSHICEATARGAEITLVELHEKLSYGATCTRAAVMCSIKFLVRRGFVIKTLRGPESMYLTPTAEAFARFKAKPR